MKQHYSGCPIYVCLLSVIAFLGVSSALPSSVEPASAPVGAITSPVSFAAASASSLAVFPTIIVGGNVATGEVFLSAPAPAGGAVVSLSSSGRFASVPKTVKVYEGETSATFNIRTKQVTSQRTATISATYGVTVSASITVTKATALSSVMVDPTTVVGGTTAKGTANLTGPAPTGGLVVALASDNPSVASVPASVTVPEGSSSANFTVTTSQVVSSTSDTISATYGTTASASLTIVPVTTIPGAVALLSVNVNPTTVVGGESAQGTANLTGAAPTGGAIVSLASDNPSVASVPPSVTVPEGSTSANFGVTTSTVVNSTSANITGNYSGAISGASLTVQPAVSCPGFVIEGFGRNTTGGCGGRTIFVTNLNDSGPGSFRDAVTQSGARIVRFQVAGWIRLLNDIQITNGDLTIDGSDAPAGGIGVRDRTVDIAASNVIVRYMRFRIGPNVPNPGSSDALRIYQAQNVVIDHVSTSWALDEVMSVVDSATDITVQWSVISEGLDCNLTNPHPEVCHSRGLFVSDSARGRVSIVHNLIAHNAIRNPETDSGDIEVVNNLIFNHGGGPMGMELWQPVRANVLGNYFQVGLNSINPTQSNGPNQIRIYEVTAASQSYIYAFNNLGYNRPSTSLPQSAMIEDRNRLVGTRFSFPTINDTDAWTARNDVLAGAGATLPCRDAVDQRVIGNATTGTASGPTTVVPNTGRIINDPSEVGGWPDLTQPCSLSGLRLNSQPGSGLLLASGASAALRPSTAVSYKLLPGLANSAFGRGYALNSGKGSTGNGVLSNPTPRFHLLQTRAGRPALKSDNQFGLPSMPTRINE